MYGARWWRCPLTPPRHLFRFRCWWFATRIHRRSHQELHNKTIPSIRTWKRNPDIQHHQHSSQPTEAYSVNPLYQTISLLVSSWSCTRLENPISPLGHQHFPSGRITDSRLFSLHVSPPLGRERQKFSRKAWDFQMLEIRRKAFGTLRLIPEKNITKISEPRPGTKVLLHLTPHTLPATH